MLIVEHPVSLSTVLNVLLTNPENNSDGLFDITVFAMVVDINGQNIKVEEQPDRTVADSKKQKNVFLLSTIHSVPERCETSGKPEIVLTHNMSKGGVDTMGQMAYDFTEKTKRWLLAVMFNIIDLSTYASRVIRQARIS
ncbi:PiggyBac transposable element-derived protein 4 [Plakobranchus ocellatus]|uniref:PiggyBac transposable element-derived protein 4 n=1 Tax=Plakobranchus ocellatus TaxID=259542 RepID=A0AAV3Y972_9GAST|nr:PiggyBac transposable element-derived protein 4 [Plakobranchus ocellatus]